METSEITKVAAVKRYNALLNSKTVNPKDFELTEILQPEVATDFQLLCLCPVLFIPT